MNIGIDIDNTISYTLENLHKYIKEYIIKNNLKYIVNEKGSTTMNIVNWKSKVEHEKFSKKYLLKIINTARIKEGAKEYIKKLKEEGYIIHIITARSIECFKDPYIISKEFLNNNGIEYDFLQVSCKEKDKYCIKNNIKILVDDEPSNIIAASKHIKVIIPNEIHNQGIDNKNTIRVNSWEEIYKEIKNIIV